MLNENSGVTEKSVDFYKKNIDKIGAVIGIACDARTGEKANLYIFGSRDAMRLTGCSCGYGGEGPHGTAKILQTLGIAEEEAEKIIYESFFIIPSHIAITNKKERLINELDAWFDHDYREEDNK